MFLKAGAHPVAHAVSVWVTSTMFAVQFEGGAGVATQGEFASRDKRYSPSTYIGHLSCSDLVLYAIDAFPAEELEAAYPGTVEALFPDGNLSDKRIVKMGCGRLDRIGAARTDLNKILPGHDPRPIFIVRVPAVTTQELGANFEKPLHEEFSDVRIGHNGRTPIPGPRNGSFTELFAMDADLKEMAQRLVTSWVDHHTRQLSYAAEKELGDVRKELAELTEMRMENRIKNAKIHHLEEALLKSKVDAQKGEDEVARLKDTIVQILPRKMSALKGVFARSSA